MQLLTGGLELLWAAMNSPIGLMVAGAALTCFLGWLYRRKPTWQRYEGTIVRAIKLAEKEIPDTATNKSLQRMDRALRYVLEIYQAREGRKASTIVTAQLVEAIDLKHAELERTGGLVKLPKVSACPG